MDHLRFLHEEIKEIDNPSFENFKLTKEITVGEWVDFEGKLKLGTTVEILHNLLSVIIREDEKVYDSKDNQLRADYFYKNMDIVNALSYLKIFMAIREGIYSSFKSLFESDEEEVSSGSKNIINWGWIGFLFDLCDKDITKLEEISKMPIILALNWSLYQNDMIKNLKK